MAADGTANNKKNLFNTFIKRIKNFASRGSDICNNDEYESLDTQSRDMIRGIFELSGLNARDIMIPRVDTIAIDSRIPFKSLVNIIRDAGHSRLPVFENTIDNIIGILHVKDLISLLIDKPKKKYLLKKILRDTFFVPETMPLKELLYEFQKRKLHLAVVVDEYGGVAGIVTLEDILEEIVGEINDEHDADEIPELTKKSKYVYELDPRMTISDFNEYLGQDLPREDFDTIGGFILNVFGKIPKKNEIVKYNSITFKIKEIKGTIISRIIVSIPRQK